MIRVFQHINICYNGWRDLNSCPLHSPKVEEEIISLICNKNDIAKH